MKVHLTNCGETELVDLMQSRAEAFSAHELTDSPQNADLILLLGSFGRDPGLLLDHPSYQKFPEKCAVYTEDDNYLPLAPGVYCSAHDDQSARAGRVFSYTYVSRNGRYQNPYLSEWNKAKWSQVEASVAKRYLFTFQGGSTSLLRKRLFNQRFNRADVFIQNTSNYYHWDDSQPDRSDRQLVYAETLAASHFVLCPRGAGLGTIRMFEVMSAGIAPVLISDGYVLPPGPDWDKFMIRVPESKISSLAEILEPRIPEARERGQLAKEAFEQFFSMQHEFDSIVGLASRALRHGSPSEETFRRKQAAMIRQRNFRNALRDAARSVVLKTLKVLRLRNPYQMNR